MVVRTEHLWDDLIQVEEMILRDELLLQHQSTTKPWLRASDYESVTHGSDKVKTVHDYLKGHEDAIITLCCFLHREEIPLYMELIQNATNLNDTTKLESITTVQQQCPMLFVNNNDNDEMDDTNKDKQQQQQQEEDVVPTDGIKDGPTKVLAVGFPQLLPLQQRLNLAECQ